MVKIIKKLVGGIIFFFLIVFLPLTHVNADEPFAVSMNLVYDFLPDGRAKIIHNIHLINRTSSVYAKEYLLELNFHDISNITAFGRRGKLPIFVTQTGDNTVVKVNLTEPIAGLNQKNSFTINYEVGGLAQKIGRVWEIVIPVTSEIDKIDEYNIKLEVPQNYGPVIYLSPPTETDSFFWSKKQLKKHLVTAVFGQEQFFDFEIDYQLFNSRLTNQLMEIALPPDNNYQKVAILDLEPQPINVIVDDSNNWLAQYKLMPGQNLKIQARGFVNTKAEPAFHSAREDSLDSLKKYLDGDQYWPVNSAAIKQALKPLPTIEDIYRFVINHLQYDYQRLENNQERIGAEMALLRPQSATSKEFTDLFIALARSQRIPAREINGFVYTTNNLRQPLGLERNILHSWPEYFDLNKKTWVAVDPTLEKGSGGIDYFHQLDLNHFALIIKGNSSTNPQNSQNVLVVPSQERREIKTPTSDFVLKLPNQIVSGFTRTIMLEIDNFGPTAMINVPISINSPSLFIEQNLEIKILPPFARENIPLRLQTLRLNSEMDVPVVVKVDNLEKNYQAKIIPFYKSKTFAIIVFGMVIISTLYLKRYFTKK